MEKIYFQNGMDNNYKESKSSADMIGKDLGVDVGVIANKTGANIAHDVLEYLPNGLYLKDALNSELYQDIANNGNAKNLVIMHSAGNEDAIKAAKVLAVQNINLDNKIDVMSVGSPASYKKLEKYLSPVGMNVVGSYNNILDPVTNSKSWAVGSTSLLIAGGALGIKMGLGAVSGVEASASATTALGAFVDKGIALTKVTAGVTAGGLSGFGTTKKLLTIQHPFARYYNNNFKNLSRDIRAWHDANK